MQTNVKKVDFSKVNLGIKEIAEKVNDVEAKANFGLMNIPLNKMRYNPKNNFGMRDIEELSESLKRHGQLHNIVVRHIDGTDEYEIISGERRHRAASMLGWETLATKVVNADEIDSEMMLIIANLDTRELNDMERSQNAIRLTELIQVKRKQGEDFGGKKTRELVADKMGIAPATVQKLIKLQELIPEFKKMVEDGDLALEVANQYAQMPEEAQIVTYQAIKDGLILTAKQAKELKDKLQQNDEEHTKVVEEMKMQMEEKEIQFKNEKTSIMKELDEDKQEAIKKVTQEFENKISKLNNELLNAKEEIKKQQVQAENMRKNIEAELEEKIKKDADPEVIKELKLQLEQAKDNEAKLKESSEKQLNELQIKLRATEDEAKIQMDDYEKKLNEKKAQELNIENTQKNVEIVVLAKQAQKSLTMLLAKVEGYKHTESFTLSDEAKGLIDNIFKIEETFFEKK